MTVFIRKILAYHKTPWRHHTMPPKVRCHNWPVQLLASVSLITSTIKTSLKHAITTLLTFDFSLNRRAFHETCDKCFHRCHDVRAISRIQMRHERIRWSRVFTLLVLVFLQSLSYLVQNGRACRWIWKGVHRQKSALTTQNKPSASFYYGRRWTHLWPRWWVSLHTADLPDHPNTNHEVLEL